MAEWRDRLDAEYDELVARFTKLRHLINSAEFAAVPAYDQELLYRQLRAMAALASIIGERVGRARA